MAIDTVKRNGHFSLREKYNEIKDGFQEAMQTNKMAVGKFKRMAQDAVEESGERVKDAVSDANKTVKKNPWPYVAGASAAALLFGFILGRKK